MGTAFVQTTLLGSKKKLLITLDSMIPISGPRVSSLSTVQYINITGPIPENPFGYDDGLLLMTEEELQAMDLSTILRYSSTLSTSIRQHTSTLRKNQSIAAVYTLLKGVSQNTINFLTEEIELNTALINAYGGEEADLGALSTGYISSLSSFDLDIAMQQSLIDEINSTLSSYSGEYDSSISSIAKENEDFISAAKHYSTLYWIYQGYQDQLDAELYNHENITSNLSTAIKSKEYSYSTLTTKTKEWSDIGDNLSSLYKDRSNINSTLTQYRIDEGVAYINYMTSIADEKRTSSIYVAAVAAEKYALAVADTTQSITDYNNAKELFDKADAAYQASVSQSGGGPTGPIKGNSALWSARNMALQALQTAEGKKQVSEESTSKLMTAAEFQNVLAYQTTLEAFDSEINAYRTVKTNFQGYKASSLDAVTKFSSIYEESLRDVSTYTNHISMYSTFYESSLIGASSLLGLSEEDQTTIQREYMAYFALSGSIRMLTDQYDKYSKQYASSMAASTLFTGQYYSSLNNVSTYTIIYDSTNKTVATLSNRIYRPGGLMSVYAATKFTNSSLLNDDILAQKIYDTQMMDLTNMQDLSMYQYRETFCRTTQIDYQTAYETAVLAAVQQNQAAALAQGTSVPPTNLNTPLITSNYSNITSINAFLTQFSNIYTTFNTQGATITNLSTSVGYETEAWSTTKFYTTAQYFGTPRVADVASIVKKSGEYLTLNQDITKSLLVNYSNTQAMINSQKIVILNGLSNYYTFDTIQAQHTEISSFILQSLEDAQSILESQGLVESIVLGTGN
jgi:hypothetical protein